MSLTSHIAFVPPVLPSKWDIIPIHNSDRAQFKRCRRYWNWSSPARSNLTLRADVHGINTNFWFGTGIHWALEQYYNPLLKRDPVESWKTWFDIQWRGGVVEEYWLDKVYDLRPRFLGEQIDKIRSSQGIPTRELYEVKGLEEILPDPDHFVYDEFFELGVNMMKFYKEYAAKNDDFEMIAIEHDFSVPIWDYANNKILTAMDMRPDSPNAGKILEVHARGRMDGIWRRPNGKYGLIDHKTAEKIGEDYFLKMETDEQITSYLWAAEVEAKYYDLPYKEEPLEELIYNTLRKAYPKPPTQIRGGMFSVDREKESCTYDMLQTWIKQNAPGVPLTEKQQGYVNWLKDIGDEQFIIRKFGRRNRHQIANAGRRIYQEALDMLDPDVRIYPNIRNDFSCLNCQFRSPCMSLEDGGDWQAYIDENYTTNKDR